MLTKNFSSLVTATSLGVSTHPVFTDRDGNTSSIYDAYQYFASSKVIGILQNKTLSQLESERGVGVSAFGFGSGTSKPSSTDITITLIDDTDIVVNTISQATANTQIVVLGNYSYNGTNPITISEIGYFTKINDSANTKTALFAREVLPTPITVTNGETFTVYMVIGS